MVNCGTRPRTTNRFINEGAPDVVQFSVKDQTGTEYSPDRNNPPKTKLETWLMMYGSNAVESFFVNTNAQLEVRGYKEMSGYSKAIKFQGIMRLCTRFAFSDWDKLWSNKSENKFIDPPNFGKKTGMFHDQFKQIFICQRYSRQLPEQPEGVPLEQYQWMLIDNHVSAFNKHHAKIITPSGTIVVNKSISRWYGTVLAVIGSTLMVCLCILLWTASLTMDAKYKTRATVK